MSPANNPLDSRLMGLTYLRIALIPVVMALTLRGSWGAAAGVFGIAAITDFFDGYLARRWKATTVLGSFLDTTADKLLVAGALIALVEVGRAWAWVAFVIVGRELVILGLRGVVASDGLVMTPSFWGKLKANVQFVAILLALLRPAAHLGPLLLDEWVMVLACFVTVMSGLEYLARHSSALAGSR
ncbi:MAG: CDP-diacylglycerol--glycerol-3-phosphate 3-phosphatidyltransferase [Actinomycetota bacterium]